MRSSGKDFQAMKSVLLVCVLAASAVGQTARTRANEVTPVTGVSWLDHLHRSFEETSMGKTGQLGPPGEGKGTLDPEQTLSRVSTNQSVSLRGADLYRLNCWGCHGESGLGAPPEINSVINPTRSTSTQLVLQRMKSLGMEMSRADAAQLASQSQAALLKRLHQGGTDMPPFPHLNEAEIGAIVAYLKQLAGFPGAEHQQVTVAETRIRIGEHIVKSTCHVCHSAAGPNPSGEQLFNGAIPPLSTLTTRTSLPEFERKVTSGAPITMGTPASPFRGRMPVFYYLTKEEAADAYLYLKLYPPVREPADGMMAANEPMRGESKIVNVDFSLPPTNVTQPSEGRNWSAIVFPVAAGLLVVGGLWFTLWEIRRLTVLWHGRNALGVATANAAQHLSLSTPSTLRQPGQHSLTHSSSNDPGTAIVNPKVEPEFHHNDYYRFERSWLERWLERGDEAA